MAKREDEAKLIGLAAKHDPGAEEEIFRRYRSLVFTVAQRITRDREEALEAVQMTFVKFFRSIDNFERRSSLKTWITRIAGNCALDLYRARRARPDGAAASLQGDFTPARVESPGAAAERRELAEAIRRCLAALSAPLASVLTMFADGGMRYAEIAESLGVAKGTVMSRLFYARRKMRECLEAGGFSALREADES